MMFALWILLYLIGGYITLAITARFEKSEDDLDGFVLLSFMTWPLLAVVFLFYGMVLWPYKMMIRRNLKRKNKQ